MFPCFIPNNGNMVKLNSFSLCINRLTTFLFIDYIWIIYLIYLYVVQSLSPVQVFVTHGL